MRTDSDDASTLLLTGWLPVVVAAIAWGTFAMPYKAPAVMAAGVHPLVFQTYKTLWVFVSSFLSLLWCPLVVSPLGLLSGLAWVLGGLSAIVSVRHVGLGVGQGTWSAVIVLTSFLWGTLYFEEPLRSTAWSVVGVLCLATGVTCMAVFGNASSSPSVNNAGGAGTGMGVAAVGDGHHGRRSRAQRTATAAASAKVNNFKAHAVVVRSLGVGAAGAATATPVVVYHAQAAEPVTLMTAASVDVDSSTDSHDDDDDDDDGHDNYESDDHHERIELALPRQQQRRHLKRRRRPRRGVGHGGTAAAAARCPRFQCTRRTCIGLTAAVFNGVFGGCIMVPLRLLQEREAAADDDDGGGGGGGGGSGGWHVTTSSFSTGTTTTPLTMNPALKSLGFVVSFATGALVVNLVLCVLFVAWRCACGRKVSR
jgi:hypothetical protein